MDVPEKREIDFSDPHLLGTLASLVVSVPVFLYFLYQMIANRNDWDMVFDDDGNVYSETDVIQSRLSKIRRSKGERQAGGRRFSNDVCAELNNLSAADAYAHIDNAQLQAPKRIAKPVDVSSIESNTPPTSPPSSATVPPIELNLTKKNAKSAPTIRNRSKVQVPHIDLDNSEPKNTDAITPETEEGKKGV